MEEGDLGVDKKIDQDNAGKNQQDEYTIKVIENVFSDFFHLAPALFQVGKGPLIQKIIHV